ncbi:hypothetical protein [Vibrio diazotrophicus]|uniref:hypothetical protein n=1 Tax=Vibrio diazotrophicus TaxID=685 RepID=UPI000C9E35B0|nr:hypothetical protein [Vibrio diazotrophicus]PNH95080.1 hypothetical protein C1M59_03320 [Vibrio diazotrophicus]
MLRAVLFRLCGSSFTPEIPRLSTISPVALSFKRLSQPKMLTFDSVFVEFFGVVSLKLKAVRD